MNYSMILVALALAFDVAAETSGKLATPHGAVPSVVDSKLPRVTAVTSSGRGQAGYVHYFLITHPDASLEYHVGIELEDQRVSCSPPRFTAAQLLSATKVITSFDMDFHHADYAPSRTHEYAALLPGYGCCLSFTLTFERFIRWQQAGYQREKTLS